MQKRPLQASIMLTVHGFVSGRVQGVGFRYFVKQQAQSENVCGYAKNLINGSVEFLLQGDEQAVQKVIEKIHQGPSLSQVDDVDISTNTSAVNINNFTIG